MTTTLYPSSPPASASSAPMSPALAGPRPWRWTCAEFHHFGDMGAFAGRRAMLIDGVLMEQGPMNPPHAITLELVEEALRKVLGGGWRFRNQSPLILGQDLDPEPDFAVIAGTPRGHSAHPTTADLVVEVADSSLDFDTNEKRLLYARAGIRDYWVVDINGRRCWSMATVAGFMPPPSCLGRPTLSLRSLPRTRWLAWRICSRDIFSSYSNAGRHQSPVLPGIGPPYLQGCAVAPMNGLESSCFLFTLFSGGQGNDCGKGGGS